MTRRRAFLSLGLGALAVPSFDPVSAAPPAMPSRGLCAHRGAMVSHPENTLPAFGEALRLGARMIEFDVQLTRDGALVLMHDDTIDRTTNQTGKVSDLTLSDLRKLDAGIRHGRRFAGTAVPTLEEALEMMPTNVWLNCHLKGGAGLGEATAKVIREKGRLHQAFLAAKSAAATAARATVSDSQRSRGLSPAGSGARGVTVAGIVEKFRGIRQGVELHWVNAIEGELINSNPN